MTNRQNIFKFKQFSIINNLSGMKVGTDGVLLGTWAHAGNNTSKILDIGTGCGLISIIMAQRNPYAEIHGIEIDSGAVEEATENVSASPWYNRIKIIQSDILKYDTEKKYDIIVSNPPFFANSLISPDGARTLARHCASLPLDKLFESVSKLLEVEGKFSFIFPADRITEIESSIESHNMKLTRMCKVYPTTTHTTPKRLLCECMHRNSRTENTCKMENLSIEISRHQYTDEYIALTRDFYLNMP